MVNHVGDSSWFVQRPASQFSIVAADDRVYRTDPAGSLIGGAWLFVYGTVTATAAAWIYDRVAAYRRG